MKSSKKYGVYGAVAALAFCAMSGAASAADGVARLAGPNPASPIVEAVTVPAGYTFYFLSGAPASPVDPKAPKGSAKAMGDTPTQTASSLGNLKKTLTALGLNFGNVVKATVFMAGDPAKGGEMDFAGMNKAWSKEFGTKEQPNKPSRSTIKVAGLASPGALVEIEMIAVKK
ncbi:MAG TPA: RidA family protein [Rhizomicrobium sp.]|jgi:enamine deaminase RidA (YjgF/YER057c/UK114 family)|nr:RidA family protein [Rhizomicrobium sp.]